MNITITEYPSRSNPYGKIKTMPWDTFLSHVRNPVRTEETLEEYANFSDEARTNAKDVGGYIGGRTENGYRSDGTVLGRCLITIDADDAKIEDVEDFTLTNKYTYACHTTHSSTTDNLRVRWIFPLTREVDEGEYRTLVNIIKKWVGVDSIDEKSYLPYQLMFWPSCCSDAEYMYWEEDLEWVDPDDLIIDATDEDMAAAVKSDKFDASAFVSDGVLSIPEGNRNNAVFSFAVSLRRSGLDERSLLSMIEDYNEKFVNPPLADRELRTIAKNVCKNVKQGDPIPQDLRTLADDFGDIAEWKPKEKDKAANMETESLSAIMKRDIPEPPYAIKGIVPVGLTCLTAEPKMGKSWMALDMAISVATGTPFMDEPTNRCGVVYLALEDNDYRLHSRGIKVAGDREIPDDLVIAKSAPTISENLIPILDNCINTQCPTAGLVIIDTLQMVRGTPGKTDGGAYAFDYKEITPLQQYAISKGIALVVVHHTNKGKSEGGVVEKVNGSFGLSGSCDGLIVLERENRKSKEVKMHVFGRDVEQKVLVTRFNNDTYRWDNLGDEETFEDTEEDRAFDVDPVVKVIVRKLDMAEEENMGINDEVSWTCTSSELLAEVSAVTDDEEYTSPTSIARHIRKIAYNLENKLDIKYEYVRKTNSREHVFTRAVI